jgi:hypothetical protein
VSLAWIMFDTGYPPANRADGKIAFLSAHRHRKSNPATASHTLTGQELGEKYEALSAWHKAYVSGAIAAFESLHGGPP